MENFLSAEELHSRRTTSDRTLPRRGSKCNASSNDLFEEEPVKQLLQDRAKVISEAKVEILSSLMRGEWLPDERLVVISGHLGKHFHHMGYPLKRQNMLFPEEALYLMDINSLEVYFNELPLSMQEAYVLFLEGNLAIEKYQVYSHLSRLGYIIVRHQGRMKMKHSTEASCSASLSDVLHLEDFEGCSTNLKRLHDDSSHDSWEHKKIKTFQSYTSHGNDPQVCLVVKHPEVQFPDVFGKNVLKLTCPNKNLLPPNVVIPPKKSFVDLKLLYCKRNVKPIVFSSNRFQSNTARTRTMLSRDTSDHFDSVRRQSRIQSYHDRCHDQLPEDRRDRCDGNWRSPHRDYERHSPDSRVQLFKKRITDSNWRSQPRRVHDDSDREHHREMPSCSIVKTSAQCWKEHKLEISKNSNPKDHRSKLVNLLSTPIVQPLVTSKDLSSLSCILDKLRIIKQVQYAHFPHISDSPNIDYDVYLPNTDFKKTLPQLPNHRLVVTRIRDQLPKINLIAQTMEYFGDKVGLNFAVVDSGDIAFYSFNDICLPQEICME